MPVTPLPIRTAASAKPAIAQVGNERGPLELALATAGRTRVTCDVLVVAAVVAGATGSVAVRVCGGVFAFGLCLGFGFRFGFGSWWRRCGGGAAAVVTAVLVVLAAVVVEAVVSVAVVSVAVVSAAVESPGAAAGARAPTAKPNAASTSPAET
jgi:hypothetical protein